MGNGTMQRPLKTKCRLRFGGFVVVAAQPGRRLIDEIGQFAPEQLEIYAACPQDPDDFRRIQQSQ